LKIWYKLDEFKRQAFAKKINIGYKIINIFSKNEKTNLDDFFILTFEYKNTSLSVEQDIFYSETYKHNMTTKDKYHTNEVIEELYDLSLLKYEGNIYGCKFKKFISQQLSLKYIEDFSTFYESQRQVEEWDFEISELINNSITNELLPMDFLKLYTLCIRDFKPQKCY